MGVHRKRDDTRYIIFQQKTRKTGKKTGKTGGKTPKKKGEKNRKKRKIQEIQKQDYDEVLGNAEIGNKFSGNAKNGNENKN